MLGRLVFAVDTAGKPTNVDAAMAVVGFVQYLLQCSRDATSTNDYIVKVCFGLLGINKVVVAMQKSTGHMARLEIEVFMVFVRWKSRFKAVLVRTSDQDGRPC